MKYSIEKAEKFTVFSVAEEFLNSLIAPSLKSEFIILRNEGIPNLILDLSNVKYVDSSGLSAILTANRLWKPNGSFVLTGVVHPSVEKLMTIARIGTAVAIVPTLQQAKELVMLDELQRELTNDTAAASDDE